MTAQYAIHELKQVLQVLQGLAERERLVEEEKAKGPQGPAQTDGFPD